MAQWLKACVLLQRPVVCRFGFRVRTWHHLASHAVVDVPHIKKVEEDGHGCELGASLPQQKEEDWQQMLAQG